MSLEKFKTQILLLHSEQKTLNELSSGFSDKYSVHCATSGIEALNTLGDTPIHVIVCAQDLPGMSGLEALREAKKRSPETIGILLAGTDASDGLEALVGEKEVFQIIRGKVNPDDLRALVETATRQVRMETISKSANDTTANMDMPVGETIVMETAENGTSIISDGTGTMPALKPQRIQASPNARGRNVDILVLSKDEEFLGTIRESSLGLHEVHHANTPSQAEQIVRKHKVGILVTDAAMVGSNIEVLTQRLRITIPRLVAVVAGRRDDGELLMDLINRGQVYRFLLKPVSPGRVRLAIEASIKHHLDAADTAFKGKPRTAASPVVKPAPAQAPEQKRASAKPAPAQKSPGTRGRQQKAASGPDVKRTPQAPTQNQTPMRAPVRTNPSLASAGLDSAFDDGEDFAGTMTNIATSVGKSISGASSSISDGAMAVARSSGNTMAGITALIKKPIMLAAAGGLIIVAVAAIWMMTRDSADLSEPASSQPQNAAATPVTDEPVDAAPQETVPEIPQPLPVDLLQSAHDARAAGNIVSPAGANAMEFYIAALNATPDDEAIAAELAELKDEAFSLAESALLENRSTEAARALRVIGLADPENSRLNFLNVQLEQQQLRVLLDQVRVATRESRFEDAGRLLTQAETIAGVNTGELDTLSEELAIARGAARSQALDDRSISAPPAEAERQAEALAAANRAEAERVAEQQAQDRQAEADRIAAEKAAAEQVETDRVAAEKAAAEQIETDRLAAEAAAAKKAEDDRIAAEQAAAEKAEADRIAADKAAAEKLETDRLAAEAAATKKTEDDRIAAQQAAAEKAEADRIAAENAATEKAEADRVAAEQAAAESAETASETVSISAVKRIRYVAPKFPRSAQRRNISGWVDLSFTVTIAGEVADLEIINAEPETIFIDSVIRAVEQWGFEPATENGQPVEKRVVMRLSFNLE